MLLINQDRSLQFAPEYQQLKVDEPADYTMVMVSGTDVVCKPSSEKEA